MSSDAHTDIELAQRELLLREAERIVHLGSWMWDTATDSIRWSDEMLRILGYEPGSVTPTVELFFGAIHPDDVERVQEVAARGLETAKPAPVDFRVVRPDGEQRFVHMEAAVATRSESLRLVGSVLDRTERVELEERLRHSQKMEAVGALAGGVAHDFNNYLQVIFGHLHLALGADSLDEQARRSLDHVHDAARRCQQLTQQLLSFGRRNTLSKSPVLLNDVCERIAPMLRTLLGDSNTLDLQASEVRLCVEADSGSLEQVLMNLATNARDAMPEGGTLTLSTDALELADDGPLPPGWYARVSVRDEGQGIDAAVLPRVFEPFFSTKRASRGTGLGLASAWGIVEQSGGTIAVESEVGRGTVFHVLLPLLDGRHSTTPPLTPDASTTVLIVEDQDEIRALVRAILEGAGYQVMDAADGVAALELYDAHREVDIVLTDVSMPRMDGMELARALKERGACPVVLMTGVAEERCAELELPLLRKPAPRRQLLSQWAGQSTGWCSRQRTRVRGPGRQSWTGSSGIPCSCSVTPRRACERWRCGASCTRRAQKRTGKTGRLTPRCGGWRAWCG
jgi:PAS domain S-box-containing protein